jgi:hypothetical protein
VLYPLELVYVPAGPETKPPNERHRRSFRQDGNGEDPAAADKPVRQTLPVNTDGHYWRLRRQLKYGIDNASVEPAVLFRAQDAHTVAQFQQRFQIEHSATPVKIRN